MTALSSTVAAVKFFVTGDAGVSEAVSDSNLLELLTNLPKLIKVCFLISYKFSTNHCYTL